ncbi:MAG TPA: endonuclease/exonuclease/phosphatase family protein [Pyrinomonadaceae bacterium]|nr:endonuclease/exonuclease/phosphatase family protein [Pyrinomonadaceae bacterium]
MKWIAITIGVLGIVLTIKPFIKNANWLIRLGDFPRLQVLILLVFALFLLAFSFPNHNYFDYFFGLFLIVCIFYQVRAIMPFTIFYRKEVQSAREPDLDDTNIALLIFNVLMENREFERVLELIETYKPDVVLLAEPNDWWAEKLAPLKKDYPNWVSYPLENHYGMILFSRFPLHDTELQFLIQDDIPSIHTQIKLQSGDDIALHGVHPRPPVPEERGRSTERDGELLLVGKAVRESNLPCIVAGDLNDAAWSQSTKLFKRISGLLDPRVGRGFYNTFHANYKFFRLPLDHIFHSHHFRLIHLERIKNSCGSDHFPVFVQLSYEKDATREQAKPIADIAETEEAHELIGEALKENRFRRISFRRLREKIAKLKSKISRKK